LFINQIFAYFHYVPLEDDLCIQWPISSQGIGIALVGAMISTGLIMRIFYLLIRLFGLYTRGIIFVSWVMEEGRKLKDAQDMTV
jgi:hypothetical protein